MVRDGVLLCKAILEVQHRYTGWENQRGDRALTMINITWKIYKNISCFIVFSILYHIIDTICGEGVSSVACVSHGLYIMTIYYDYIGTIIIL